MLANSVDTCEVLFSLVDEASSDIVAMTVVSKLLKKRGIHADIQHQTLRGLDGTRFGVFMLRLEDDLVGLGGSRNWSQAQTNAAGRRGIADFSQSPATDPISFPMDFQKQLETLMPKLEAAMQKMELEDATVAPSAESRSGPRL
jgi:hypothetical protein